MMFKRILSHFGLNCKTQNPRTPHLTLEEALWTSLFHGYNSVRWEQVNG